MAEGNSEGEEIRNSDVDNRKLKDIFVEAWNICDELEQTSLKFNSEQFQNKVKTAMTSFEFATQIVSRIGMFSSNEIIDEVPTDSLQYLLLPYFLGKLVQKLQNRDRVEVLQIAEVYFRDFLQRCGDYGLYNSRTSDTTTKEESETRANDGMAQLMHAAKARNDKIAQFRQKKELEEFINQFKNLVKSHDADEETTRDFFLRLLKKCVIDAGDELSSLKLERQMAEMHKIRLTAGNVNSNSENHSTRFSSLEGNNVHQPHHQHHNHQHGAPKREPIRPFIITRDNAQKAVFGMGYPSLPIMTVDEFYQQRVNEGIFPDEEKMAKINREKAIAATQDPEEKEEQEKAEQELQIEADDPEYIERMRRMDEYRDMVRRGDGNRYNRS